MQEMVRTFTTGGIEGLPTRAENLLISPTRKNPPSRLTPPKFYFPLSKGSFPSPLDNNFRVITYYNPIKTLFLAIVIAPVEFFFFILLAYTGRANFDFNQCSIFTECCLNQ